MIDAPSLIANLYGALTHPILSPSDPTLVVALATLVGTTLVVCALLKGWHDWLDLKRRELDTHRSGASENTDNQQLSVGAARIELADMKERIKKLEAIASGVEL